jgi:hypothetical protein
MPSASQETAMRGCPVSSCNMRNLPSVERIEQAQALLAELKAIAVWDRSYWCCPRHEMWETIALVSRCRRRIEILSELGFTMPSSAV